MKSYQSTKAGNEHTNEALCWRERKKIGGVLVVLDGSNGGGKRWLQGGGSKTLAKAKNSRERERMRSRIRVE